MAKVIENVVHLIFVGTPLTLFLLKESYAFEGGVLVALAAVCSGYQSTRRIKSGQMLSMVIDPNKSAGLRQALEICFSHLWFIPSKHIFMVSDALWSALIRRDQPTIYTALKASDDSLYLIFGLLGLLGIYVGYQGEFGYVYEKFTYLFGRHSLEILVILLSSWMTFFCFFNWSFRKFLLGSKK